MFTSIALRARPHLLLGLIWMTPVAAAFAATGEADEAANHLEFESQPDGRCQILSRGGKLRVVHNRHVDRAIEFRQMRTFAGGRPQGLVVGVAPAGGEAVKLGCTEVDGRPQDWVVQRARFSP